MKSYDKNNSLIANYCFVYRCAEGYKGQRCENKDIYNLASKFANGFSVLSLFLSSFSLAAMDGIKGAV